MTDNDKVVSLDPQELLRRDPAMAERVFNRLSLEEQVRLVVAAAPDDRESLCALSRQPRELIRAIPPQEIWLTMQSIGGAEAMSLFQYTSAEQVQFCLDVECWRKDRFVNLAAFEWLRLIAASGEGKIRQFFDEVDEQLIGLISKRWLNVYLRIADEDPAEVVKWSRNEAPVTLDGTYYFQVANKEVDTWFRPMLELYGKLEYEKFVNLLISILGVTTTEQEELAYSNRSRRLVEFGFPEWEEAIGVYHRLKLADFARLPRRQKISAIAKEDNLTFGLIALQQSTLFLREVLQGLSDDNLRSWCGLELSRLANRILIADGYQISVDSLKTALRKAISYCSLGVETVSGGDLKSGIELVMEHWMTNFFQMGFSLVSELSEEVKNKMIDKSPHVTDDPTDPAAVDLERVQAATWKWPKFYLGPYSADGILHRDFCSCADLRAVRKSLEKFI